MANLIPPKAIKRVKQEYWLRVASLWMIMAASALVMVSFLAAPVYVLVKGQISAFSESYESAAQDDEQFKKSDSLIKEANQTAILLETKKESYLFSMIIEKLTTLAGAGVHISGYKLDRNDEGINEIVVTGMADTRFELADFKTRLESDELFESAALPLSNLAKDIDVPFSIKITPVKPVASKVNSETN